MAITKWNRPNRTNGHEREISLMDSPLTNFWPSLASLNSFPTFGRDLIQDFFDDNTTNRGNIGRTLPAVNISETDSELMIEVAAPGMQKKDFKIEVVDNNLHISYQKENKNETEGKNHWRKEFSFESFERTFALPTIVESDNINATYNDGILTIHVPKKEEARKKPARSIEIK